MKLVIGILAVSTAIAFAAQRAEDGKSCCAEKLKVVAHVQKKADDCCADKATKKTVSQAEKEFLAEAKKMEMQAEGKKECCKSTHEKPIAKGDAGCCNAKTEPAKFKVFVAGEGYKFYGCEGSAKKGRAELVAHGKKAGDVQKVTSKVLVS